MHQWRMVVIVTGCALFVTSYHDVIFTFSNPSFWRSLLTQWAYYSKHTLLIRCITQ